MEAAVLTRLLILDPLSSAPNTYRRSQTNETNPDKKTDHSRHSQKDRHGNTAM